MHLYPDEKGNKLWFCYIVYPHDYERRIKIVSTMEIINCRGNTIKWNTATLFYVVMKLRLNRVYTKNEVKLEPRG